MPGNPGPPSRASSNDGPLRGCVLRARHERLLNPVHGEFVVTLRLASETDRGNGTAKRSGQGRHGRVAVCQIVLLECSTRVRWSRTNAKSGSLRNKLSSTVGPLLQATRTVPIVFPVIADLTLVSSHLK